MTRAQLSERRVTAGDRYSAALRELWASLVDLGALDRVLDARSYNHDLQELPALLEHPTFAPRIPRRLVDEIRIASDAYLDELNSRAA
jgi:hypothetical protein